MRPRVTTAIALLLGMLLAPALASAATQTSAIEAGASPAKLELPAGTTVESLPALSSATRADGATSAPVPSAWIIELLAAAPVQMSIAAPTKSSLKRFMPEAWELLGNDCEVGINCAIWPPECQCPSCIQACNDEYEACCELCPPGPSTCLLECRAANHCCAEACCGNQC